MQINYIDDFFLKDIHAKEKEKSNNVSNKKKGKELDFKDEVKISNTGKKLLDTYKIIGSAIKNIEEEKEINWKRIEEIKEKIQNHYYDDVKVHNLIAEKILKIIK